MDFCRSMADVHIVLWIVPLVSALALAGLGARLSGRALAVLSLGSLGWVLVQVSVASIFLLWGAPGGYSNHVVLDWMTWPGMELAFSLDRMGAWALMVSVGVALAAQIHALASVSRFAGRHRFFALIQVVVASAAFLYTAGSRPVLLIGWEGLALGIAFMAGFWEAEQSGGRVGMRWLLSQRLSGMLLLLGLLLLESRPELGLVLMVAAALVRAGLMPFHGWLLDTGGAPASAKALVFGVGSTLASVHLLMRLAPQIIHSPHVMQILGVAGVASVALGLLAGLHQHNPDKRLGWLFVVQGGLVMLGFALGDPVAATLLVTAQCLLMGGLTLATGSLVSTGEGTKTVWRSKRAYWALGATWALPASVGFVGLGRLFGSVGHGGMDRFILVAAIAGPVISGWIMQRIYRDLRRHPMELSGPMRLSDSLGMVVAPALLAAAMLVLGVLTLSLHGLIAVGGWRGVSWAGGATAGAILASVLAWLLGRREIKLRFGRLTRAQRVMEWIADSGLGIGELVVQLPLYLGRMLGVILWRVVSVGIIDTLILGTVVRTIEGVGTAIRFLNNGRIQRSILWTVLTLLLVLGLMVR